MGACLSCLGFGQNTSDEPSETEGLLYDDQTQSAYGTLGQDSAATVPQPDPEELRKEREALERICADTSNELIDVLNHSTVAEGSKMAAEYPHLLNKHFAQHKGGDDEQEEEVEVDEETWLGGAEALTHGSLTEVKGFTPGGLFITLNEPTAPQTAGKKASK